MKAKLGVIRGGTKEEVMSKKFNIYLGISLGNKWFNKENIKKQIIWGLKYTKEKFGLLVADTLHAINYEVKNNEKEDKARAKSLRKGDEMISVLKEIINELPTEKKEIIEIIRWDDVKKDPFNKKALSFFYNEFNKNPEFKEKIKSIVERYLKSSEDNLDTTKIEKLCSYILEELPELLNGFNFNGTHYNCYLYPYDGELTRAIEKIQKKKIFPEFHDKLDIKNNVFVELR